MSTQENWNGRSLLYQDLSLFNLQEMHPIAKPPLKGPLCQMIWTYRLFARFTSFVKIAALFTWTPFANTWEFNICQTLLNSWKICYLRQVLYFWTYLVLTKNPATDTPTVLGNFSVFGPSSIRWQRSDLNKKKLASSTELRKWICHRFVLLPCIRQETPWFIAVHIQNYCSWTFIKQLPVISDRHPLLSGQ